MVVEGSEKRIDEEDEIAIDFSKIKKNLRSIFSKRKTGQEDKGHHSDEDTSSEDDVSVDITKATSFAKENAKWLIPLLFILLAIGVSTYFRMMPSHLPITDGWAENTVSDFYRSNIVNQINQQYPHLPEQNRNVLVQKEWDKFLEQNQEQIDRDISQLSQQYKTQFQDENGDTYLLAIDPYLWWSQARNVVRHGHQGDKFVDGESRFSLRDGRLDKGSTFQLHPYFAAYLYKFLRIFDRNISLMRALFLLPAIIIGLSLIPAFFIGRRISGNVGGLFAAVFLAINGPLLSRTPAGFADTDPYNILMPLLIFWLALEAYCSEKNGLRWLLSAASGFLVGVYSALWTYSYIFFFVIITIVGSLFLSLLVTLYKTKFKFSVSLIKRIGLWESMLILITFFVSSTVFVTVFRDFAAFQRSFSRIIRFTALKEVGIKNIWPNVLTTVAEFNTSPFSSIVDQMGGNLFFVIALLGVVIALFRRDRKGRNDFAFFCFLTVWFVGSAYAFTKGMRFSILMAPPFAIALGSAFGWAYGKLSLWINKGVKLNLRISQALVIGVMAMFLISPFTTAGGIARNEVPTMNDAWYDALIKIRNDGTDGIITSWWDFGHWFQSISERRVTFDGGDQGQRIHWVGRTLLTDDEAQAVGILRMLNCVQETAPKKLDEFTGDSLKSVQILYQVFPISDRSNAYQKYRELGLSKEQAAIMLDYTHCENLIPNYYITSEDMVGKAGVWGHFGSWDFEKATMYQTTKKLPRAEAVAYLTENFGLTEEQADSIHNEIQATKGDRWIAPWPGYGSGFKGCEKLSDEDIRCVNFLQGKPISIRINLNSMTAEVEGSQGIVPDTLVYATLEGMQKKELEGKHLGISAVIAPAGDSYKLMLTDPLHAAGTFTKLFFLEGHGMKCFSKFDDRRAINTGRIITWKVDYECQQGNNVFFQEPETVPSIGESRDETTEPEDDPTGMGDETTEPGDGTTETGIP